MSSTRLLFALAALGATPFLACGVLFLSGIETIEPFGRLDRLTATYGLGILSFLTGIHWATYLYREQQAPFNLLLGSNVVFLAVWFAYVLTPVETALATQALAFLVLLAIDFRLMRSELITRHYFGVRTLATTIAWIGIGALLIA